jgi:glutaminase
MQQSTSAGRQGVAKSEAENRPRNAALAHLLASYHALTHPVDVVLDQYTALCAIAMSCRDLARAAGFLARQGLRADGGQLLSRSDAKLLNATMLTCGTTTAPVSSRTVPIRRRSWRRSGWPTRSVPEAHTRTPPWRCTRSLINTCDSSCTCGPSAQRKGDMRYAVVRFTWWCWYWSPSLLRPGWSRPPGQPPVPQPRGRTGTRRAEPPDTRTACTTVGLPG